MNYNIYRGSHASLSWFSWGSTNPGRIWIWSVGICGGRKNGEPEETSLMKKKTLSPRPRPNCSVPPSSEFLFRLTIHLEHYKNVSICNRHQHEFNRTPDGRSEWRLRFNLVRFVSKILGDTSPACAIARSPGRETLETRLTTSNYHWIQTYH